MSAFANNILERLRTRGWRTALYAAYRLDDAFQLWRLGIRSVLNESFVSVAKERLGFDNPEFNPLNPTESFHSFRVVMKRFVDPGESDVFLDYGSGVGRALLMAATFPFRKVIGVEYSEELSQTAAQLIQRVRPKLKCRDIELVTGDASAYELPPDVNVLYFYNPFCGEILAKVCDRIRQSLAAAPRNLKIIYYMPGHLDRLAVHYDWLVKRREIAFPAVGPYPFALYENLPITETRAASCKRAETAVS